MDKSLLIVKIIAKLDELLGRYAQAARVSAADATDEQNRAENKYDTRGLEASYLAAGQGRQVVETAQAREAFAAMTVRAFEPEDAVAAGALVEVEDGGHRLWFFLGPSAGGTEVEYDGREVLVITAQSPLGRQLVGKRAGETLPGGLRVAAVS